MHAARLFFRLIVRPLLREPLRALLTALAAALGVAVVAAIDLAAESSTGSFRSSLETLSGEAVYEISAVGGVPERVHGDLVRLPYPGRFAARLEDYALVGPRRERVPFFGVDLFGDPVAGAAAAAFRENLGERLAEPGVLAGAALGYVEGDTVEITVNDRAHRLRVAGVLSRSAAPTGDQDRFLAMDIAHAQRLLDRLGKIDRIYVYDAPESEAWQRAVRAVLPDGVAFEPAGARSEGNRRMLRAFRLNLRVLSFIAMIVGAFLIYNTIAVSVVRRRTEIGVLRALGASRAAVRAAFLLEGALFGLAGSALGIPLGWVLAEGAVEAMSATVSSLYVTSTPGEIRFSVESVLAAVSCGLGTALLAAWLPAAEASSAAPSAAMGRARIEYDARRRSGAHFLRAVFCVAGGAVLCFVPAWNRIPVAGYAAAILLIAGAALATPAAAERILRTAAYVMARLFGAQGFLAARGLAASLARTSALVAALATAAAMTVSIGIMVGSFRDTVILWMNRQLAADLYVRPVGRGGGGFAPTMAPEIADRIQALPEVSAVDRFRSYAITYNGLPATLAFGQVEVHGRRTATRFLEGPAEEKIWASLAAGDNVIVSEPFSRKHDVHAGDYITLPPAGRQAAFRVAGVYYDYSGEQGFIVGDRSIFLQYLPDPRPSNLAVYLHPGVDVRRARQAVMEAAGEYSIFVATNRTLREQGIAVFDRTFAITYALEAVAIVVAVLGMAGGLLALVIDRRREIGVLRFVGASARQIRKMALVQAGLLGMLANLMGLVLGVGLSLVLIYVINEQSFGWTIQFHWPVGLLLAGLTGIHLSAVLAGLYPARLAAAVDPSEAVHEE